MDIEPTLSFGKPVYLSIQVKFSMNTLWTIHGPGDIRFTSQKKIRPPLYFYPYSQTQRKVI